MDTKKIYEILNSIVTNDVQTPDGIKSELMFIDEGHKYSAEEMAELINQMDVEQLGNDEIEMLEILHRRLSNDNSNGNLFTNEETLVGPLSQKITEYNHVVENQEFESNMTTLESLKARNQRMSNVNAIHLSEKESDSHYNLDYVSVRVNGKVEMIPISDPDYMERFVNEHANDISEMTEEDFYNTLKNSLNAELDFVPIDKYLSDSDLRARMNNPKIDEHIITFEIDEVKRLVEQFIPGTEVEISIDRDGEVFYRAGDAVLKGKDKDGHRNVEFVQKPGKIENYVDNKAIDQSNIDEVMKEAEELGIDDAEAKEGRVGMKNEVHFNHPRFGEMMPIWKDILSSGDTENKEEFFDQLDAYITEGFHQMIEMNSPVNGVVANYVRDRMDAYKEMKDTGKSTSRIPMTSREFHIFKTMEEKGMLMEIGKHAMDREDVDEDFFGFDEEEIGTNVNGQYDLGDVRAEDVDYDFNQEQSQNYDIDSFAQTDDVETYQETYNNANEETVTMDAPGYPGLAHKPRMRVRKKPNGMTAFVLLLEMLTVAMIIMMFLSLDI